MKRKDDILVHLSESELQEAAEALNKEDIPTLIDQLTSKDDDIRYQAFQILQTRSLLREDVYPYWEIFRNKLNSDNSYHRSIGLMLIARNAKWDTENWMEDTIDAYLSLLNDEKPITIRQCIQALEHIVSAKPVLSEQIAERLISFDLMAVRETMRKSILMDILNILLLIRKERRTDDIENYIIKALSGEILDKKSKKQIEARLL